MSRKSGQSVVNRQIFTEASEWFAAFRFDDVDVGARERFTEWMRRSPEHIQAYLEVSQLWADLPDADPRGRLDIEGLVVRARASNAEVVPLVPAAKVPPSDRRRQRRAPLAGLLAASVVFACLAAALVGWLWGNRDSTYTTGIGEQRSIALSDGSGMDLNAGSAVRVHFSHGLREVELVKGQALFRVAKDRMRPFVVLAGPRKVIAVGTQFDVYRRSGDTLVTVLEGRVAVTLVASQIPPILSSSPGAGLGTPATTASTDLVFVSAGEQAIVTAQAAVKPAHADVVAATAWVQKKLVFEATPLSEVVEQFNRYNSRRLIVDDPRLATVGISGIYSSTDPSSLLLFLRDQSGIRIVESEHSIHIVAASP